MNLALRCYWENNTLNILKFVNRNLVIFLKVCIILQCVCNYLQIIQKFINLFIRIASISCSTWVAFLEDYVDLLKYHIKPVILKLESISLFEIWTYNERIVPRIPNVYRFLVVAKIILSAPFYFNSSFNFHITVPIFKILFIKDVYLIS